MKIIIFGPQGSGKGTQAELIARRHGWPYISTGDIFRYHQKNQTELGKQVAGYLSAGDLVPDELTNKIVADRIQQPDCMAGFVLDGYPRNAVQTKFLNSVAKIDLAFAIELTDEQAVKRLEGRLACKCGLSYHIKHNPPNTADKCDKCGGELFQRDDDQPQAIARRLKIYHQETEPLFADYEKQGILRLVNGDQSIEDVYEQIDNSISSST